MARNDAAHLWHLAIGTGALLRCKSSDALDLRARLQSRWIPNLARLFPPRACARSWRSTRQASRSDRSIRLSLTAPWPASAPIRTQRVRAQEPFFFLLTNDFARRAKRLFAQAMRLAGRRTPSARPGDARDESQEKAVCWQCAVCCLCASWATIRLSSASAAGRCLDPTCASRRLGRHGHRLTQQRAALFSSDHWRVLKHRKVLLDRCAPAAWCSLRLHR